jgi:hypothetical protein
VSKHYFGEKTTECRDKKRAANSGCILVQRTAATAAVAAVAAAAIVVALIAVCGAYCTAQGQGDKHSARSTMWLCVLVCSDSYRLKVARGIVRANGVDADAGVQQT